MQRGTLTFLLGLGDRWGSPVFKVTAGGGVRESFSLRLPHRHENLTLVTHIKLDLVNQTYNLSVF